MSRSHSSFTGAGDGPGADRASSWRASTQLFPTITLTKEEQVHYDVTVGRVLERALREYESFNGLVNKDNWALVRKRKQMSIYRNLQGIGNPRVTLMMGTGLIPGTVEEVMDGLYCDTTEDLRAVKALIKHKFLDGGVFHVCESRAPEAPFRFAGIKWFAARTAFGGALVKSRDLLTYERMGATTDANGHEVAYHILQSINRPEWPADCIRNVRRAYTSTCYLFRRRNNVVECFLWGEFYANGLVAQRLADYGVAGIWMNVVRAPQCAEAKKLTQLMARATPGGKSAGGACDNCHQRPGYFDKLRPCAGCRQRICKSCASRRDIFQFDWHAKRILSEDFCLLCVTEVSSLPVSVARTDHSVSSLSEHNYENAQYVHQTQSQQTQSHHQQYEGSERLSKLDGPLHHHRNTVMSSSTFTHSTTGERPSQLPPSRFTIQEEEPDASFVLTEANLRSFERGLRASREPSMDVEEKLELSGVGIGIDSTALETDGVVLLEPSDASQQHELFDSDATADSPIVVQLTNRPRQPGRASV